MEDLNNVATGAKNQCQPRANERFCKCCYGIVEAGEDDTCSVCGQPTTRRLSRILRVLGPLLLSAVSLSPLATECPELYLTKREPQILGPVSGRFFELCNREYAVLVSEVTMSPLYAVERLTPAQMKRADQITRSHVEFGEDYRLPVEVRATSYSFSQSGWDRGHLAAAADFGSKAAQDESFLLSNVVPQSPKVNRGVFADIERAVRHIAHKSTTHVVTGPLYLGAPRYLSNTSIAIPSNLYKAVYSPQAGMVGVYVVGNGDDETYSVLSVDEFTRLSGIDVFPTLPDDVRAYKALPKPFSREVAY